MDDLTDEQQQIARDEQLAHDIKEALRDIVYRDGFDGTDLQAAVDAAMGVLRSHGRTFPFKPPARKN